MADEGAPYHVATKAKAGTPSPGASRKARAPRVDVTHELIASLNEAADILAGHVPPSRFHPARASVDVRAIRRRFGLSQAGFAKRFGFTLATLREWEQGRRQPEAAARVLLLVIAKHPDVVDQVLAEDVPRAA